MVIWTLHTTDVSETVNRVIDFFPPHQQKQIRVSLAPSLRGVVSQRPVPRADGRGLVPAVEVLVSNGRVRDLTVNSEQTHLRADIVAESAFYGMQTFDQALVNLYRSGLVTLQNPSLRPPALTTSRSRSSKRVYSPLADWVQSCRRPGNRARR